MHYSKQRQMVLDTMLGSDLHPTADMVYHLVRKEKPDISLATVYRNLNMLTEQGALRKIFMPNGSDRFDWNLSPHDHMVCQCCGKVFDISSPLFAGLETERMDRTGFQVTRHDFVVYGICKDCLDREDTQEN